MLLTTAMPATSRCCGTVQPTGGPTTLRLEREDDQMVKGLNTANIKITCASDDEKTPQKNVPTCQIIPPHFTGHKYVYILSFSFNLSSGAVPTPVITRTQRLRSRHVKMHTNVLCSCWLQFGERNNVQIDSLDRPSRAAKLCSLSKQPKFPTGKWSVCSAHSVAVRIP
jgi:hypothetical protein